MWLRHHQPPFPKQCQLPLLGCCVQPEPRSCSTTPVCKTTATIQHEREIPTPDKFTCFRGLTLSCCVSRSTSWGELSSCPCGWRAKAATSGQQRRSPGAEIRGEASPTRSPTRGSPSSHRGSLLSCISLWKREKEMENNKWIFWSSMPMWVLWTGVNHNAVH